LIKQRYIGQGAKGITTNSVRDVVYHKIQIESFDSI